MITSHPLDGYETTEQIRARSWHRIAMIGPNCLISERASIYFPENLFLGANVRIDDFTVIVASSPIRIGDYVHISTGCALQGGGGIEIGDFSALSTGCKVISIGDDYGGDYLAGPTIPDRYRRSVSEHIEIGKHCTLGANTVVLPGASLGEGAATGAGAVVNKPLDAWTIYGGVPAKPIKARSKKMLELEEQLKAEMR